MNKELSVAMESCLVFAARYAHARNTGACVHVVNAIIDNWDNLSETTKEQIKTEASEEALYSLDEWQKIIDR